MARFDFRTWLGGKQVPPVDSFELFRNPDLLRVGSWRIAFSVTEGSGGLWLALQDGEDMDCAHAFETEELARRHALKHPGEYQA